MKNQHEHAFAVYGHRGWGADIQAICLRCECGEETERPPTEEEKQQAIREDELMMQMHAVCHEFYHGLEGLQGYEAMEYAEKFVAEHPEHAQEVRVDDNHHCGSSLILLDHRNSEEYWGTTCCVIPQCTGEKPVTFFLYPGRRRQLIAALQEIERRANQYPPDLELLLERELEKKVP